MHRCRRLTTGTVTFAQRHDSATDFDGALMQWAGSGAISILIRYACAVPLLKSWVDALTATIVSTTHVVRLRVNAFAERMPIDRLIQIALHFL